MIHKEGIKIIIPVLLILAVMNILLFIFFFSIIFPVIFFVCSLAVLAFLSSFFRNPKRNIVRDENIVYAPADGKIVVVETTEENEFIKEKCIARWFLENDTRKRGAVEGYVTGIVFPKYGIYEEGQEYEYVGRSDYRGRDRRVKHRLQLDE